MKKVRVASDDGDPSASCADTSAAESSCADAVNMTREFEGGGEKPFLRKPLLSRDLNAEKIAVKYR